MLRVQKYAQALGLLAAGCAIPLAQAQEAAAPLPAAFQAAQADERDAETSKSLSDEGRILCGRDRLKLSGFQYCSQAVVLAERGELRLSIQAASKVLHLGETDGDKDLVALAKRDLAIAYNYAGYLDKAEEFAQAALAQGSQNREQVDAPSLKVLGDVASRRKQYGPAVEFYRRSIEVASPRYAPIVRVSLANTYIAAEQPALARKIFNELPPLEDERLQPFTQRVLGNLLLAENKPQEALRAFELAAAKATGSDGMYQRLWAYEGMGRGQLALGNADAARKAYLEAAQLSDSIRSRFRSEEFKLGLFGDLQQIFETAITLSMNAGDAETAWRLSESSRSRALLDILRDRLSKEDVAAAAVETPTLASVQQALRENERLIEFHSVDNRLYVWAIGRNRFESFSLDTSSAALAEMAEQFRQSIFARRPDTQMLAAAMYDRIVAPLRIADGERLIIVPHGALHYVPFQALRKGDAYLIERHPLAVAPSAGIAVQLLARRQHGEARLVAFGNPLTDERYALPAAEKEVEIIRGFFPDSEIFLRNKASKAQFRQSAGTGRILHVAAHAEVDSIDPIRSRILLAGDDGSPASLEAREIYGMDLRGVAMVTISACESGLGRIARGDEVLGFTRSFLAAGSSTLVLSLWPVADRSTEMLMEGFYGELAAGAEAVDAMRSAQLKVMKNRRYAAPFYWAPFNLIGDWRTRTVAERS